jgi:hypothetical protein
MFSLARAQSNWLHCQSFFPDMTMIVEAPKNGSRLPCGPCYMEPFSFSSISLLVTTLKCHGWAFCALGARMPHWTIRSSTALSTGWSVNDRVVPLRRIESTTALDREPAAALCAPSDRPQTRNSGYTRDHR